MKRKTKRRWRNHKEKDTHFGAITKEVSKNTGKTPGNNNDTMKWRNSVRNTGARKASIKQRKTMKIIMQTAHNGNENSAENGNENNRAGFRKPNCRTTPASPRKNPKSSPRDTPRCTAPPNINKAGQRKQARQTADRPQTAVQTDREADREGRPKGQNEEGKPRQTDREDRKGEDAAINRRSGAATGARNAPKGASDAFSLSKTAYSYQMRRRSSSAASVYSSALRDLGSR